MNPNEGGGSQESNTALEVEIDGEKKTITAEDYVNLVNMQKSATSKFQSAAAAVKAAERYGVSVEDFINHAEGTMGAFSNLVDQGIIDKTGQLIKTGSGGEDGDNEDLDGFLSKKKDLPPEVVGLLKKASLVGDTIDKINTRMESLEKDQLRILHRDIQKEIQEKHPELDNDDIAKVFGLARKDRNKTVWDHASAIADTKKEKLGSLREQYAKEFGVDLKTFDANKLDESDPTYGSAAIITKGKELSFGRRKGKGENTVSPRQATIEYFKKLKAR